jgi:uncharacterized protein (DUF433 family)
MKYSVFLVRDPQICGGELTVKGTRVTVRTVLATLAEGATEQEVLADFPTLTSEGLRASLLSRPLVQKRTCRCRQSQPSDADQA